MSNLKTGLLYLGLHHQLVRKFGVNGILSRKEFFIKIGRFQQISRSLRPIVIKEMEERNLIKTINRDKIQILQVDIDLEKDVGKIYKLAGIY